LGPSATIADKIFSLLWNFLKRIGVFFSMLLLHFICDIVTFIVESLALTTLAMSTSGMLVSSDVMNNTIARIAWERKLVKPPDKRNTNNNQIIPLFLIAILINFTLIGMNPANGTFNSKGEIQSTI
jgi:hypothetical protein